MCDYCLWMEADHWPMDDDVLRLAFAVSAASVDGAPDAVPPLMIRHLLKPVDLSSCDSVSDL